MTSISVSDLAEGKKPDTSVAAFGRFMEKLKPQMALALPRHMHVDRMVRLALTAYSTTPHLSECTTESLAGSIMVAVQMGLEIGVGGQGYLIPYWNNKKRSYVCNFIPGWKGLVDLVARAGRATVWTGVVFAGDFFEYQLGDAPFCKHKPSEDGYPDNAQWTHVYAIGRVRDSQMPVIEVWSRKKVLKHLDQYNRQGDQHYAKANENNFEMFGRKVALLQVLKYMPASIELNNAIAASEASDAGKGVVLEGDFISILPDEEKAGETVDQQTGEIVQGSQGPAEATETAQASPKADSSTNAATNPVKGSKGHAGPTFAQVAERLQKAANIDDASIALDAARDLPADQRDDLAKIFAERFEKS